MFARIRRQLFASPAALAAAALAAAALASPAHAAGEAPARLLLLGADGASAPRSETLSTLAMDALPPAETASQQVLAALLRSNPVSVFASDPAAGVSGPDQFFLIADLTLEGQGDAARLAVGGEALTLQRQIGDEEELVRAGYARRGIGQIGR
ncbi:MAG: hypothetical protein AAF192_13935, partial [Pseudomonadota bacterium]